MDSALFTKKIHTLKSESNCLQWEKYFINRTLIFDRLLLISVPNAKPFFSFRDDQVMAFYNEPQWAVVGDTFPVGCLWGDSIVYRKDSFEDNPDSQNPKYK